MSTNGHLPAFCSHCGTILDMMDTDALNCSSCGYQCQYADLKSLTTITYSEDTPIPTWLTKDGLEEGSGPARATVEEACPKCNHPEMEFYTMQLRSADEGQTVFYECKKCGHLFSVNT